MTGLFILTVIGCFAFHTFVLNKKVSAFPLLFIAVSVLWIYLFGLIGFLEAGLYSAFAAGLILLLISVVKIVKNPTKIKWRSFIDPSVVFLVLGCVISFVIIGTRGLSVPDDFSHWFRISKIMYYDNSYPVTPEIRYLSYPPGTATWIYMFTKAFGFNVRNCLLAQTIMVLSSFCPFFGLISMKGAAAKRASLYLFVFSSFVVLSMVTLSVSDLTVDSVLGFVALACLVTAMNGVNDRSDYVILLILVSLLALIKTASAFFIVMVLTAYLHKSRDLDKTARALRSALLVALPVCLVLLYFLRNSCFYGDIGSSAQGFSMERYSDLFRDKSPELVMTTVVNIFLQSLLFVNGFPQVTLVWLSFLGIFILSRSKDNEVRFWLLYAVISYSVFIVSLTAIYIFSMDSTEAIILSGFPRYLDQIAIVLFGMIVYMLVSVCSQGEVKMFKCKSPMIMAVTSLLILGLSVYYYSLRSTTDYVTGPYTDKVWNMLSESAEENDFYTEDSYLVIWNADTLEGSSYKDFHLLDLEQTFFRSMNVQHVIVTDIDDVYDLDIDAYDHVIDTTAA